MICDDDDDDDDGEDNIPDFDSTIRDILLVCKDWDFWDRKDQISRLCSLEFFWRAACDVHSAARRQRFDVDYQDMLVAG